MDMTDREFILALRSVAAEEFTDAIKECEDNPHEFSSEFEERMEKLVRMERKLGWRIMNAITSNVAAALLILALLITNILISPSNGASPTGIEGVLTSTCASEQIHDTAHIYIAKQGEVSPYNGNRSASFKNVVYVNNADGSFMCEYPYEEDEYTECVFNCNPEPYSCIEYEEYTVEQDDAQ